MKVSGLAVGKWIGAAIAAWWVHDLPQAMHALIWFMTVDYATGLIAALRQRELSSRVGLNGLVTKCGIVCFLLFGHHVEQLIGHEYGAEVFGAFGYSVNEVVSITENFARIGVPLGDRVPEFLAAIKHLRVRRNAKVKT